eukprot:3201484-Alexandrium_andersonii.AAC.1
MGNPSFHVFCNINDLRNHTAECECQGNGNKMMCEIPKVAITEAGFSCKNFSRLFNGGAYFLHPRLTEALAATVAPRRQFAAQFALPTSHASA